MKRFHYAVLIAEVLSYALIITFIFADMTFDLTSVLRPDGSAISPQTAFIAACLVGLVGAINVWLTFYYMQKAQTMQDWVIVCAWTHRIKSGGRWLSLEDFLTQHLGCQISHGLSEEAYGKLREEIDAKWRNIRLDGNGATEANPSGGAQSVKPANGDGSHVPAG